MGGGGEITIIANAYIDAGEFLERVGRVLEVVAGVVVTFLIRVQNAAI